MSIDGFRRCLLNYITDSLFLKLIISLKFHEVLVYVAYFVCFKFVYTSFRQNSLYQSMPMFTICVLCAYCCSIFYGSMSVLIMKKLNFAILIFAAIFVVEITTELLYYCCKNQNQMMPCDMKLSTLRASSIFFIYFCFI